MEMVCPHCGINRLFYYLSSELHFDNLGMVVMNKKTAVYQCGSPPCRGLIKVLWKIKEVTKLVTESKD
jgi:hypothetical protein